MNPRPNALIRTTSNIIAAFMPTRRMRHSVRDFIRRTKARKFATYKLIKQEWENRGLHPIPARYDEYDLIFGIGAACMTSYILRDFRLRQFSNPFEWVSGTPLGLDRDSRFMEKINALCTEFHDFFNYEDFQLRSAYHTAPHIVHQDIINTRHNIIYWHLFPSDISWERYFPIAREKIMRRASRLIDAMNKSQRILIVWGARMGPQRNEPDRIIRDDEIKQAVQMVGKKWPNHDIDFVFFEHDGTLDKFDFRKITVCPGAYRIQSNHFDAAPEYDARHPNKSIQHIPPLVVAEMLDNIKLRNK